MYKKYGKRILDLFLASCGLILLCPLLLILIICLAIIFKGNPFFIQDRPGLNTHLFKIIKLKTMTSERNGSGELLEDFQRRTAIGDLIRMVSFDEIPQLWNVIKGEMSIIGPRPLLPEDFLLSTPGQNVRYNVRPGITGWAQVNGRNNISTEQKYEYDLWYIENISFTLDVLILLKTLQCVISKESNSSSLTTSI